jgi:hypothetical protein
MKRPATLLAILLFLATSARPDHAPEWLVSPAVPETTLAGLSVDDDTTVADIERRFGKADAVKVVAEDGTETEYSWHLANSDLSVTTMHPAGAKQATQTIYTVQVVRREGKSSSVRTGAGVPLGANLDALVRAYGSRYMTSWRKLSSESATVTFVFSNETELSAGFSDSGTIISFLLVESQE